LIKTLAEIALEERLATREIVVQAARIADETQQPLIVTLVRNLGVDELQLAAALRRQCRVTMVDPAAVSVDPEALRELSRDICRRLRVVPLSVAVYDASSKLLRIAMADPTDAVAIAEVEHWSGCRVEPLLMSLSTVEEFIETAYRSFVTEVMRRGQPGRGTRQASITGGAAPTGSRQAPVGGDRREVEIQLTALVELLVERGLVDRSALEDRVHALRGMVGTASSPPHGSPRGGPESARVRAERMSAAADPDPQFAGQAGDPEAERDEPG
jgi:hypothetical protein